MDKILITGGSGLLGSNVAKLALSKFDVYATYNKNKVSMEGVHFFQVDLTQKDQLNGMRTIAPSLIVHCAALTDPDYCDVHPEEAYRQNVLSSVQVAEVAKELGAYLIHISTDSVFDGEKSGYKENDTPNPINVYARTKLQAEDRVLSICPDAGVVRTNIYGWNKQDKFSLAEWMLDRLENGGELPGIRDIHFSPLLVNHLAEALFILYSKHYRGILHLVGSESCSKLHFAYMIAKVFGLDEGLIRAVDAQEVGLKARRAKNTSLDVSKAKELLHRDLPGVREGLEEMKRLREAGYVEELKHG